MTEGVSIRDATRDDLAWIAEREADVFGIEAWSLQTISAAWLAPSGHVRIAERAGARAGYSIHGLDGDVFSLMNIAVAEEHRGRGIGTALLADCEAAAREAGASDVWLEVATDNDVAIRMYRSAGFVGVRVRRRYYQPSGKDALVMRVRLSELED